MPHLARPRARLLAALLVSALPLPALLFPGMAAAIEPTTVSVEVAVLITEETASSIRDRVFRAALTEARCRWASAE